MNEPESVIELPEQSFSRREERDLPIVAPKNATPMSMLAVAVAKGMDAATIKDLMDLSDRWEKNEARKAFGDAMAAFKLSPPELRKNKQVRFETSKGTTEYKHATLDEVSIAIGAALAPHGLKHSWNVEQKEGGMIEVTCTLSHRAGHSESVSLTAGRDDSGSKNNIQALGSTVTYLERYTLLAVTGMAVKGQDDDGAGSEPKAGMPDDEFQALAKSIKAATTKEKAKAAWKEAVKAAEGYKDLDAANKLKEVLIDQGKFIDSTVTA